MWQTKMQLLLLRKGTKALIVWRQHNSLMMLHLTLLTKNVQSHGVWPGWSASDATVARHSGNILSRSCVSLQKDLLGIQGKRTSIPSYPFSLCTAFKIIWWKVQRWFWIYKFPFHQHWPRIAHFTSKQVQHGLCALQPSCEAVLFLLHPQGTLLSCSTLRWHFALQI